LLATLVLIELALRVLGMGFLAQQRSANLARGDEDVVILSLGESSTALGGDHAYPIQLGEVLNQMDLGKRFHVINGGLPGIDSQIIVNRLFDLLAEHDPDIVTVMMGINDGEKEFLELHGGIEEISSSELLKGLKLYRLWLFARRHLQHAAQLREAQESFDRWEAHYQRLVDAGPTADDLLHFGHLYRRQGRYAEAQAIFERLVEMAPDAVGYCALGRIFRDRGMAEQEEATFRYAVEHYPDIHLGYRWLTRTLRDRGRLAETEAVHLAEVAALPDALSFINLANFYWGADRLPEAEEALRASVATQPNDYALARLGALLLELGRPAEAEVMVISSLALHETGQAHAELARIQLASGREEEAIVSYETALALGKRHWAYDQYAEHTRPQEISTAYLELSDLYRKRGEEAKARQVLQGLPKNEMSFRNYEILREQVLRKVGRLAVIQYPVRPLQPLEVLVGHHEGVVFVDNEESFKLAIARQGYNALFVDTYGGDFGHGSPAGNLLVAQNTAKMIAETWFGAGQE